MIELSENSIKALGLKYVENLDEFIIWGNHYFPYPSILNDVKHLFTIKTEYFGPSDQGSTKSTFTKKESDVVIKERLQNKIDEFAKLNGIIITNWQQVRKEIEKLNN